MPERWVWPRATVDHVVDGDTLDARLTRDIGFHGTVTFTQRLRLNRIDAPGGSTAAGAAAAYWLAALLVPEPALHIETVKPYKYGDEWMCEITMPDGRNVSDLAVQTGHAVPWDGRGPRPGG